MYNCRWFVLCETVVHDSTTNNMSMVNTVVELRAKSFPALHPKFAFAAALERREGSPSKLSIRLVREKKEGDEVLLTMEANGAPEKVQSFINFPMGIRLYGPESATFRLELQEDDQDWYIVATQAIDILQAE